MHIDLKRIAHRQGVTVRVPIVLKATQCGREAGGGIWSRLLREVEIECLPADIPLSHIENGRHQGAYVWCGLRVSELAHSNKIDAPTDENQPVAHVTAMKEEVVATADASRAKRDSGLSLKSSRRASRRRTKKAPKLRRRRLRRREEREEVRSEARRAIVRRRKGPTHRDAQILRGTSNASFLG